MHFKHKHMDCNHKIIGGHHASKFGTIYSNGGHIRLNYTHTSISSPVVEGGPVSQHASQNDDSVFASTPLLHPNWSNSRSQTTFSLEWGALYPVLV